MSFVCNLADHFHDNALAAILRVLQYVSILPYEKPQRQLRPHKQRGLFDPTSHSTRQLLHYHHSLYSLMGSVLSSHSIVQKVQDSCMHIARYSTHHLVMKHRSCVRIFPKIPWRWFWQIVSLMSDFVHCTLKSAVSMVELHLPKIVTVMVVLLCMHAYMHTRTHARTHTHTHTHTVAHLWYKCWFKDKFSVSHMCMVTVLLPHFIQYYSLLYYFGCVCIRTYIRTFAIAF